MNTLDARRRLLGRNVYKKTVEGNPAIAQGSLARRDPGIAMQGWTEQAQYEGNQLFDASVFDGIERSGVRVSVDNGVITASGMSESAIWIQSANMTEEDSKKFKSGNIYVKNYKTSDCNYEVGIYINNTTVKEGNSPHNIPDGYLETNPNNVYFFIDIQAGVELKGSIQTMIYQDGDGTWEPYTGAAPSPSPDYKQDVKNAGKHNEETQKYEYQVKISQEYVVDRDMSEVEYSGVNNTYQFRDIVLEIGKTYYLTYTGYEEALNGEVLLNSDATVNGAYWIKRSNEAAQKEITFTAKGTTLFFRTSDANNYDVIGNLMISDIPFKTPQTVTLTSDRQLTKWDRLEKRSGVWGWVRKSAEIVLDGGEDWIAYPDFAGYQAPYLLSFRDTRRDGYSDSGYVGYYVGRFSIWIGVNNANLYACFAPTYNAELEDRGIDNWKNFLSENPITILTYLDEETFVPLSSSEQEQMNELYTFRPTTVLSNDCECNMSLTYKTKKSLEVTT